MANRRTSSTVRNASRVCASVCGSSITVSMGTRLFSIVI